MKKIYNDVPSDYIMKKDGISYGAVNTVKYYSSTTKCDRNVSILLPPDYDERDKYPVLYLLHGLGQDHTQWKNDGKTSILLGNMIYEGFAKKMIVVMPNVRARKNDKQNPPDAFTIEHYRAFDNFINDLHGSLMPYIKENYAISEDRENTAVAGFSMGGREALYIGLTMQNTFGSVAAFCPAPGIFAYSNMGVSEDGLFARDTFKVWDKYNGSTNLMLVAATNDAIVTPHPKLYHGVLTTNGTKHTWLEIEGGHDMAVSSKGLYHFIQMLFN